MASLVKRIAKEINQITDLIDIPKVKKERNELQLQVSNLMLEINELKVSALHNQAILDVATELKRLNAVCNILNEAEAHLPVALEQRVANTDRNIQEKTLLLEQQQKELVALNNKLARMRA